MQLTNRLSSYTRWPLSAESRIKRADIDIDFAEVMALSFGVDVDLRRIAERAFEIRIGAQDELIEQAREV